jgi:hypothetical protein
MGLQYIVVAAENTRKFWLYFKVTLRAYDSGRYSLELRESAAKTLMNEVYLLSRCLWNSESLVAKDSKYEQ